MGNTQEYIKNFSDWRNERARAILEKGNPSQIDEFTYLVPSQFDSSKKYRVTHIDAYSCECQDIERRCKGKNLYCKHIKAILIFEKLKNAYEIEATPIKRDISHQFKQFYNLDLHHETIRRWVLKFGNIMKKYSEKIQPQIKGVWNAD